ncbi:MAG: universal stress protein [PVC group bacterium]|nr:universal stress protein [PVC group bacterium]
MKAKTPSLCNVFIVGVDGSDGSHNAIELVVKNLYRKGLDKIYVVHIASQDDEHKGLQYHSSHIAKVYHEYMESVVKKDDFELVFDERKKNENVFEQINEIAEAKDGTLMVLGYRGSSGSKSRPDVLSKGLAYLVHQPKIPVLVVREKLVREFRTDREFKWLVCLEGSDSRSFKALKSMCRFIEPETDIVHGLHVETGKSKCNDNHPVLKEFKDQMKTFECKNTEFSFIEMDPKENIHQLINNWIKDHLKEETNYIDFIIMGYNPVKYINKPNEVNTTIDILKQDCIPNVYFDH